MTFALRASSRPGLGPVHPLTLPRAAWSPACPSHAMRGQNGIVKFRKYETSRFINRVCIPVNPCDLYALNACRFVTRFILLLEVRF